MHDEVSSLFFFKSDDEDDSIDVDSCMYDDDDVIRHKKKMLWCTHNVNITIFCKFGTVPHLPIEEDVECLNLAATHDKKIQSIATWDD